MRVYPSFRAMLAFRSVRSLKLPRTNVLMLVLVPTTVCQCILCVVPGIWYNFFLRDGVDLDIPGASQVTRGFRRSNAQV